MLDRDANCEHKESAVALIQRRHQCRLLHQVKKFRNLVIDI
jgi:hypothetical protein